MKSLPRLLGLVLATLQLQASFASIASLDSLYIDGHCDAAVNGVWKRSPSAANVTDVTFQRQDLRLRRDGDGASAWVLVAPLVVLGQSLEPSPVPPTPSTRSSEWEMWRSAHAMDAMNGRNGTLLMASFSQEIYDLSTNLCGERLPFSRISRHLYFAGNATGSEHFLFFNCSRSSWHITTASMGLLELSATCEPSYPSHSWAICDGSIINLTLHQEFYPVTGCGSEFFPEGRTANGAPLYRADDPSGDANRYLSFDHCELGPRWILSGGSCEGETSETSAATGPPLGDADACDFAAKENIQLPLEVYKLWTLPGFSEALSEKQKLCDVAPTTFGPGEFQPDLEYLKAMAGPETLVRRMLIYSRNPEDLEEVAKELDVIFVISQGWPFAFIFLWLPLALSLLCSAIPSCHCCRCFARERRTKYRMKVLLFILLTLVLIGIATCIGIASAGLQTLEEGQLMSHCASSQLMSTTLDGDVDFVGLRPLLQRIDAVLQGQEKEAFLSRTQRVVRSAQLAMATLQLLSSTLDALDIDVAAVWHRCGYCEELRPPVQTALEELEKYLAKSPVATQRALEGGDLHDRLSAAAASLSRLQQLALEALPFLYAENGLGRLWSETFGFLVGFILLMTILLVVTFIMAYGSMASFAQEPRETGITGQGEYLRRTSACSCCSWCFFSGLAAMMCAMAGCIVVAYSQLGGFCLELHSDAKADLFRTTGLSHMADMDAFDVLGILQVTSSCLPKEGSPGATDVFALLQASPSGPSVRDVVSVFTGQTPTALPEISQLRRYVRDTPVDALLLPSSDAQSNPRYHAMLTDLRTRIGFSSSVACADWTLPGQQVIPGMETFFESFRSMGVAAGSCNSSNQSLICSEVVTTSGQACRAAQRFVKAKNLLRTKRFRCDLFDSGDIGDAEVPCDVKDMVKVNGEWQPCVPRTVHRTCDLDEFRTYLMDFDVRLSNVFQMLGEEMEMADLTDLKILTAPIPGGCENFALFWQRFLNGLCFVSLPGLRTITMSFLVASGVALSGVILMYFVWRRAYDNFSRSHELFKVSDKAQGSATPRAQGTAGTGAAERTAGVTFWISDEDDTLEI